MAKRILVVDDEKEFVSTVSTRLEPLGYEVISAYDGQEGLEKATSEMPDLIILDIMMPGMDGLEMLRRLRDNPKTFDLSVIVLTAKGETEYLLQAQELGSMDYLIKPVKIEELSGTVKKYI